MHKIEFKYLVAVFFALGLVLKIYFASVNMHPGITDDAGYITVANNLIDGKGLTEDYIFLFGNKLPENVSHPSNYFWMPMTSFIFYSFMLLFGKSLFAATLSLILASVIISYLVYRFIAEFTNNKILQQGGFIITFLLPGLFKESLLPAGRIFFALFVLWALYWFWIGYDRKRTYLVLSGIPCALAYLTRNDGILLLFVFLIAVIILRKKQFYVHLVGAIILFFIVVTPWLIRNYLTFGEFGSLSFITLITLKSYEEINNVYHSGSIADYLNWGIVNIIISKIKAFYKLFSLLIYENNMLIILLSMLGLRQVLFDDQKRIIFSAYLIYFSIFSTLFIFIFTFQCIGGSAGNSIPAFMPLFILLSIAAISNLRIDDYAQKSIFLIISLIFIFLSFDQCKSLINENSILNEKYIRLNEFLKKENAENEIIMSRFPIELNYATKIKAVMIPNDSMDAFWEIKNKYHIKYLLLPAPREYLGDIGRNIKFKIKYSDPYSDLKLYEIL